MSAPRVRVAPTQVVLDTVPLKARHWIVLAMVVLVGLAGWWLRSEPVTEALARSSYPPSGDDAGRAYAQARAPATRDAGVLLLGTSVVLENTLSDDWLSRAAGLGVVNLGGSGQSLMEGLYVLHSAPLHPGQLVVVMVTPNTLSFGGGGITRLRTGQWPGPVEPFAEAFRDQFPSFGPWLTPLARHDIDWAVQRRLLYRTTHDRVQQWASVHLYGDRREAFRRYRRDGGPIGDTLRLRGHRVLLQQWLADGYEANRRVNAQALDVLFRFIHSRGAHAVLLAPPRIAGDSLRTYGRFWLRYRSDVNEVAVANGVRWVHLNSEMAFSEGEFYDPVHLGPAGRERWSRALVKLITEWCPEARRPAHGCR